ncbi:MAG TPA: oligopeptide/dipeptide ABC transporter ATP-binding protein [Gemmatimonadaceae bacterium]|nr:oligopeptide/dipeptide ABC transporter ATP-binding protein [Gemmatimonadaceae bacterium]
MRARGLEGQRAGETSTGNPPAHQPTRPPALLKVDRVTKSFRQGREIIHSLRGVSFELERGETLGLVGESGSGKTTLARCIVRLQQVTSGRIEFDGHDITALTPDAMRPLRRGMQMVFQDPYASLNPRRRVRSIIGDPLEIHGVAGAGAFTGRVHELMTTVGLDPKDAEKYPSAFSGGQRQRIGIARAIALNPSLIVCDEAVSALDVSVRAQILDLLVRLQRERHLAYLFISHDLLVVRDISTRVAVMYCGRVMEIAPSAALYSAPRHPYTATLLRAIPDASPSAAPPVPVAGDPPSPLSPPGGCPFHPRCPTAQAVCAAETPPLVPRFADDASHVAACHFPLADGERLPSPAE